MAKSSSSKGEREIRLSETQMRQPGMEEAKRVRQEFVVPASSETTELADEYGYVIADLQRIAAIALAMLAVLIVLAVVLP
jgi:hypothetical protein